MDPLVLKKKSRVAWLSVISNTILVLFKLIVGILIGSVAVISEAIHSAIDLVAACIALFAVKTAGKPADEDHPFGHGKIENLSGTIEAVLIFGAAIWILYEAVHKLMKPAPIEMIGWGVAVMAISAIANQFVSHRLFKVGKETDSVALMADGWHLRTDVYTSAGVMVGLGLILIGRWLFPGQDLYWLDSAAAIGVALMIIHAAWELTVHALRDLIDASIPEEETKWIHDNVASHYPKIKGYHALKTRKAGGVRFIEFHLIVDSDMSVKESHDIAEAITADIEKQYPGSHVTTHVEPCEVDCKPDCLTGCLMPETERRALQARPKSKRFKKLFVLAIAASLVLPATSYAQTTSITAEDQKYLEGIYQDTFRFISDYINQTTGLPYDSSKKAVATSLTNIGFYMASIAVGAKTGLMSETEAKSRISKALVSLEKIRKWLGFPITWVNTSSLRQEFGASFSYADHIGNLIGSLLTVKALFPEYASQVENYMKDFKYEEFYDDKTGWLKGGYNTKKQDFDIKQSWGEWYYNLFASDTRFLSFYGVALGRFPLKHWQSLDRLTEEKDGYEYLAPGWQGGGLFMQYITGIFLDEKNTEIGKSRRNFTLAQMANAKNLGYSVWGWSACESPWGEYLGWGHIMDRVVTPHACVLAIEDYPQEVIANLKNFEKLGARQPLIKMKYGFRDSVDMGRKRVAEFYLMLDQTMIFLSLANFLHDGIVRKAVTQDPVIQNNFEKIYQAS